MNKTLTYIVLLLAVLMPSGSPDACTIFHMCKNGAIVGGANEDWKDPNTRMWFYPADSSRHGWVKFGFDSGFPQAGMNEYGLYWDGTANPWLAMPEAEASKTFLDGPIMEKVITTCRNVDEADEVFRHYYCQDQYRAQYLLGDSAGYSMIVEGDNIRYGQEGWQVLTNFYQSQPGLGGYPCWRFEKACEIIDTSSKASPLLASYILSATHQEGNYPTQYSIVFLPRQGQFLLFYYHNYQEYLFVNLAEELARTEYSCPIPAIFSRMMPLSPVDGSMQPADSLTISWRGLPGSTYELRLSESPDMQNASVHEVAGIVQLPQAANTWRAFSLLLVLLILFRPCRIRLISLLIILSFTVVSCNKEDDESHSVDPCISFTLSPEGLKAGTTYYWQVLAGATDDARFRTQTPLHSFTTIASP